MSRDSNGNYTLPASGNPVITGTVVSSAWANSTLNDVASALTDSLSRSGLGGMTAAFKLSDGSAAAPSMTFTNEPTTGMYRKSANDIGFSVGGVLRMDLSGTTLTTSGQSVNFLGTPLSNSSTLTVNGPTNQGISLTIASANGNTNNSADLVISRANTGSTVGLGANILFVDTTNNVDGQIQFSLGHGLQFFTYSLAVGWTERLAMSAQGGGTTIYAPTSPTSATLVVNGLTAQAQVATAQLVQNNAVVTIPHLQLYNANALGQTSIQFVTQASSSGTIRADYNSNMYYVTYGSGGHNFYSNGDAGVGNLQLVLGTQNSQFIANSAPTQPTLIINGNATQGVNSLRHADANGTVYETGFLGSPIHAVGTYTITAVDAGKTIEVTAGATYTLPTGMIAGTIILFRNLSGGNCTISAAGTLTWYGTGASGTRTLATAGKAICELSAGGVWMISGINLT